MSILDRFRRNRDRADAASPYLDPDEQAAVYARVAQRQEEFLLGIGLSPEDARRLADARARRQSVIRPEIAQRIDAAGDAAMDQADREHRSAVAAYRRAVKEECARAGVSEADFYRAEPGLLAMAWPSVHERIAYQEPVFDLDAEDAYERAADGQQTELHGLAEPQDRTPGADDVEVVTIDPAELMPAVEALRNYDLADRAVESYRRRVGEGATRSDALHAVVEAQEPDARALAEQAISLYLDSVGPGVDPEEARRAAVAEAADAATPRISAEQADQIRAALTADPVDARAADAADSMTAAQARDIVLRAEELAQHLDTCSLGEEHCPTCRENIVDADGFWDYQVGDARARLADYSLDDILAGNFTDEDRERTAPETHRAESAEDSSAVSDPFWAEAADGTAELDRDLRELMTEDEARDTILRAERLRGHIDTCTTPAEDCATCREYDPAVSDFWEVEVAAATSRLADRDAGDVILVDADRGDVVVVNPRQTAADAADRIVGEPDVNDADWSRNPPAASPVPEREPEPGSWIARNLTLRGERVPLRDDDTGFYAAMAEEARARAAEVAEVHDSLTVEQARDIVAADDETERHLRSCTLGAGNCYTCGAAEHAVTDDHETVVTAARARLTAGHEAEARDLADYAVGGEQTGLDGRTNRATAVSDVDTTLDRIDEVLAEPEPRATDAARECDRSLAEAETAVHRAQAVNEDEARAERCARWNTDDACTEAADCDRDCDGGERA